MEQQLATCLVELASRFGAARGFEEATVGRLCAADGRFFARLRDGKTFTIKKFDQVVTWFSENWPDDVEWPEGVQRPEAKP